jgi:hypothetical protein
MYPLILSFETITKLKLFIECGIPRPQDVGHLRLRYCKFFNPLYDSIAVLENVPPDAGLLKRSTFSALNVGLAGTGNRTRATCVASSGTNRSAIHYALPPSTYSVLYRKRGLGQQLDVHKTITHLPAEDAAGALHCCHLRDFLSIRSLP